MVVNGRGGVVGGAAIVIAIREADAGGRLEKNVIGGLLPASFAMKQLGDGRLLLRRAGCIAVPERAMSAGSLLAVATRAGHAQLGALEHLCARAFIRRENAGVGKCVVVKG